jgi:polyhydroxyalkanoate synthesis regulator phasin
MVIAAGAVLVLGGSAVGIAVAQPAPSTTPGAQSSAYQKFIDALATKLGVSSATLQQDIAQVRQDQGLPANGGFPGRGPGGPRGGFGPFNAQVVATTLGITPQQLRTELAGKSLAQVAQAHGKTGADVATALKDDANKRIDDEVSSGRITADQGNQRKTAIGTRIDQLVNQVMPAGGPAGGPGRAFGFGFGRGVIQQGLNTVAQTLGISVQQLRSELVPGKSLADVAQAHGKTGADVATALKDAANQRIDQAVSNGRLTADQGNTDKTNIDARIDQMVNQAIPQGGFGPGRRGPGGPGAPGGQDTNQTGA